VKKIFIFKTGSTFPHIEDKWGDFDDFVIREAGLKKGRVDIISCFDSDNFKQINQASGVIITGSHSNVTEESIWMKNLAGWIRELADKNIPVLGVCFGHQLLAYAFGGRVDNNPKGIEIGTVCVSLNKSAADDLLLNKMEQSFPGHVSHKQTVTELPENAIVLASSAMESYQAICYKRNKVWGLQFHPEFNADITRLYTDALKNIIIKDGFDFNRVYDTIYENKYGNLILERFIKICQE